MYLKYGIKNNKNVIFARFEFKSDRESYFDLINFAGNSLSER